jgi:hypothetical protein
MPWPFDKLVVVHMLCTVSSVLIRTSGHRHAYVLQAFNASYIRFKKMRLCSYNSCDLSFSSKSITF